jgi:hypothetical protein
MNIDVTMTSVIRPEILENTLETFFKYVFSKEYNYSLILNIDCIGDDRYGPDDILVVARKYFSSIQYNIEKEPNFPKAVRWIWSHSKSEFVFHLEDMWDAKIKTNFHDLVHVMTEYPSIANLFLFKNILANGSSPPFFYSRYKSKEDRRLFLMVTKPLLSPGLYRGEFLRRYAFMMNDIDNPELQIWGDKYVAEDGMAETNNKKYLLQWEYAIYTGNWLFPFWNCRKLATHLVSGRRWKREHGFFKETPFSPWKKLECEKK